MKSRQFAVLTCVCALASGGSCAAEESAGEKSKPGSANSLAFKPYAEIESGYDSNPDGLVRRVGSAFEKVESGLTVTRDAADSFYLFSIRGRDFHFDSLDRSQRWDLRVEGEGDFKISEEQKLKLNASYLRDFFSLDRADIYKARADYTFAGDEFRLRLQAKSHVEVNIGNDVQGALDPDVFNVVKGAAFDYWRADGQLAFITNTRGMLQPFAIYDFANLDYFNQVADPSIDRNAREQFGIVGIRIKPSNSFRIDLGARVNDREFDEPTLRHFRSTYFDANMFWEPIDTLKITAVIERYLREPSTAFGLVDDVRSYGMSVDWRFQPGWLVRGGVTYEQITPVGDDFEFRKLTTTLVLSYKPSDRLELFVSSLARWSHEDVTSEKYERYKSGAGFRLRF